MMTLFPVYLTRLQFLVRYLLVSFVYAAMDLCLQILGDFGGLFGLRLTLVLCLAVYVTAWVTIPRARDVGMSWKLALFLSLIPAVNFFLFLYLLVTKSDEGPPSA